MTLFRTLSARREISPSPVSRSEQMERETGIEPVTSSLGSTLSMPLPSEITAIHAADAAVSNAHGAYRTFSARRRGREDHAF